MAFREVQVFEVREVLRLWLRGEGFRSIERLAVVDRKTVRRYVTAAVEAELVREAGPEPLASAGMPAACTFLDVGEPRGRVLASLDAGGPRQTVQNRPAGPLRDETP